MEKYRKYFGIGPRGLVLSILLFGLFILLNLRAGHPVLCHNCIYLQIIGSAGIIAGIILHFHSMWILRHWWYGDRLCTEGAFRFVRHPMYAAWISLIVPGIILLLNSRVYILFFLILHVLWHLLVRREEEMMENVFGEQYADYKSRTGRFFPTGMFRRYRPRSGV